MTPFPRNCPTSPIPLSPVSYLRQYSAFHLKIILLFETGILMSLLLSVINKQNTVNIF
jgi:hypothetical protein